MVFSFFCRKPNGKTVSVRWAVRSHPQAFSVSSWTRASFAASTAFTMMLTLAHLSLSCAAPTMLLYFSAWRRMRAQKSLSPAICRHRNWSSFGASEQSAAVLWPKAVVNITASLTSSMLGPWASGTGGGALGGAVAWEKGHQAARWDRE